MPTRGGAAAEGVEGVGRVHRDRVTWAVVAVGSGLLFVAVGLLAGRSSMGAHVDDVLTDAVLNVLPASARRGLDQFARPLVIVALAPAVLVLALLAVVRRAWRRVLAATCIAVISAALTLGLPVRHLLGLPDDAYPSDHATIAFALLVALVIVWPSPVTTRGLVIAGLGALCAGVGNVSWYAHEVSDVVGSALLVAAVSAVVFAVIGGDAPNVRRSDRD